MSLTPKQQLEQVNNPNLLSILSTIQGLPTQESLSSGLYVWKKLTAEGGDFIDFVVSDNSTAYPDGAVHTDGYWYEKSGSKVFIDGVRYKEDLKLVSTYTDLEVSTLPYDFEGGCAVVLDGEIHILGGTDNLKKHYKFDGSNWVSVSTLPYNFINGCAVVLNDEIHILGGDNASSTYKKHYKFDGTAWTSVGTLPYEFYDGCAVVLNNEIHILGGTGNNTAHYKFDGNSWTSVSTLPYGYSHGLAVVLNNEIHIMGSSTKHYKFNGSSWVSVSTLPYDLMGCASAVVLGSEIHMLGGGYVLNSTRHYKFDGSAWTSVRKLPYDFTNGKSVVLNNEINILGNKTKGTNHHAINVRVYREVA